MDDDLVSDWIEDSPFGLTRLRLRWSDDAAQEAYDSSDLHEVRRKERTTDRSNQMRPDHIRSDPHFSLLVYQVHVSGQMQVFRSI